jgi:DNA-binding PadR family transcriptional regulator
MDANMKSMDRPENPLALAMMSMLAEGPMHPYEVATTLRTRHGEDAIKIRFGSLYSVIAQLTARGWIVAHETAQSGNRPEHTKYRLTDAGREALTAWMRDLLAEPVKEYPKFEAALCLMAVLPHDDIAARLGERLARLETAIGKLRDEIEQVLAAGLDPLFLAEADYRLAMLKAERDFCEALHPKLAERAATTALGASS